MAQKSMSIIHGKYHLIRQIAHTCSASRKTPHNHRTDGTVMVNACRIFCDTHHSGYRSIIRHRCTPQTTQHLDIHANTIGVISGFSEPIRVYRIISWLYSTFKEHIHYATWSRYRAIGLDEIIRLHHQTHRGYTACNIFRWKSVLQRFAALPCQIIQSPGAFFSSAVFF